MSVRRPSVTLMAAVRMPDWVRFGVQLKVLLTGSKLAPGGRPVAEWEAELARLKSRAASAAADARVVLVREAEGLDERLREARNRLDGLHDKGEAAWESARKDLESTWASLRAGVKAAAGKLTEK